jgi:hypothetical protein
VTADVLAGLRADAARRAPGAPGLDGVIEDAGRQRLAAYYLYSALIAGLIGDDGLPPERWPPQLAAPMRHLGLTRLAPRTRRGLDAELTPAEQVTRRSPDRRAEFARQLVDLINHGAFGPVCGNADSVRIAEPDDRNGFELELLAGGSVTLRCRAEDHWELFAQYLAGAPQGGGAGADGGDTGISAAAAGRWLKETGIAHAVEATAILAVPVYPLGVAAGLGTRLVRSRIRTGREQADAFRRLGEMLRTLRAQADAELRATRRELR